jgi:DNA-binding transcriptional ArsR family regulator
MRESKLLPILRSQTQGELLARLFLNPDSEFMISDLARKLKVSVPGLHHEVVRLFDSGYIFERREGRNRLIRANTQMAIAEPLTTILALTYGPLPVIEDALKGIKGINRAFIYGSWAKRYMGEEGSVPNDIDLGIIGSVKTDDIYEELLLTEEVLGREVNFTIFTATDWKNSSQLIKEIKRSPQIDINLK